MWQPDKPSRPHAGEPAGDDPDTGGRGFAAYPDAAFAVARIDHERDTAASRYVRDRDLVALGQTMARLDVEEAEAKGCDQVIDAGEALRWLQDLPALWRSGEDSGRRLLTEALFERIEVLGVQSATIHPTPEADAHGWSDAFGPAPLLLRVGVVADAIGMYGRGERSQSDDFDCPRGCEAAGQGES